MYSGKAPRWFISAAMIALAAGSRHAAAQNGVFELVPVRASGVEGVDWELGPGPNEITLATGGQSVEIDLFLSDWGSALSTYQATLDCAGFTSGEVGTVSPIMEMCELCAAVDFCQGVDCNRIDFIFYGYTNISFCAPEWLCPDGTPGTVSCAGTLFSIFPDEGLTYYGATFAVTASGTARGTFTLGLDPDHDATYITLHDASNLYPDVIPAMITVPSGRCCRAAGAPLGCLDDTTAPECEALGGTWTEGAVCSGIDETGDFATGGPDGLDDACPLCTQDSHCDDGLACTSGVCVDESCVFTDLCDDTNACTSDVCTAGGCAFTVTTPAGFCCDPATGDLIEIDDGDVCTADICDDATGTVTHERICQPVPAVSSWGLGCLGLVILIAAKVTLNTGSNAEERT